MEAVPELLGLVAVQRYLPSSRRFFYVQKYRLIYIHIVEGNNQVQVRASIFRLRTCDLTFHSLECSFSRRLLLFSLPLVFRFDPKVSKVSSVVITS